MSSDQDVAALAADYWSTSIIDIHPGSIKVRGYPIQELIGNISFPKMIWLMIRGELPTDRQAALLEATLVASVDHGPHAPSIAISRMAISCGLPLNGAMASAINTLDDNHGGAGEQAVGLFHMVQAQMRESGIGLDDAVLNGVDKYTELHGKYLPGFGHRFHHVDPRAGRLLSMVDDAVQSGDVTGEYAAIARGMETLLKQRKARPVPMNIDGATAVIYAELGFAPALARGIFCLSRAVGILSHAWEQSGRPERNKGPIPRQMAYRYDGPGTRHLPETMEDKEGSK